MRKPIAIAALLVACQAPGTAVPVDRVDGPEEVRFERVLPGVRAIEAFEIENLGVGRARFRIAAPEPFFVVTPSVEVAGGGTSTVRVGLTAPGYEPLRTELSVSGPYSADTVRLVATFELDVDGDGFLANQAGGSDCNDDRADINPAAPEVCDGFDNDCDGLVDEDAVDIGVWYRDADGDTWGADFDVRVACDRPEGYVARRGDCDDDDASIHPGASEIWYDGVDQDCDGASDYDQDADGFDSDRFGGLDCRDTDRTIHPGATEIWYDGIDQDCDGASDYDQDADGFDSADHGGTDCVDTDATIHPGAEELDNGVDDDCDLLIDEDFIAHGDLVFTEIMVHPTAVTQASGQYAELLNVSERTIHLRGMSVETSQALEELEELEVAPQGVVLLCLDPDPAANGGLACDGGLPEQLDDDSLLEIVAETPLDTLDWSGFAVPTGASLELGADHLDADDNDLETSWCTATETSTTGDAGTPGVVDDPCAGD